MDAEEYFKTVVPGGKRSALDPYWNVIQRARAEGYTLKQIMEFLEGNGVQIGIAGISAYIKRKEAKEEKRSEKQVVDKLKTPPDLNTEIPVVERVSKPSKETELPEKPQNEFLDTLDSRKIGKKKDLDDFEKIAGRNKLQRITNRTGDEK